MKKYLLKYEDALKIVEKYNNNKAASNFWESQYKLKGYKLCTFNYFICGWNDFANPLNDNSGIEAFDMRGATFVFNIVDELWNVFYMLPKFFNINQVESTQYSAIKDKKIINVSTKEDGSLISFMMLPNRDLFSKTIGSFVSEQAEAAYKILHTNPEHVSWVKSLLDCGLTPLFEYVSWDNRIVLKYESAHLRFIGVRCNNGDYYPAASEELKTWPAPNGITVVKSENATLDELIERAKVEENKEGWVVLFEDGQLVKIKTDWYFKLHGLRTENVFREDYVIENYLKEKLDDIISQLDPSTDKDAFEFVDRVIKSVDKYMLSIDELTFKLKEKYLTEFNSNWSEFATLCHKEPYFGLSRVLIETPEDYLHKKIDVVLKRASKLKLAKELIDKWENK